MANNQFPYYIEDWVLYLANRVDEAGKSIDFPFFRNAPIKLANYDRSFIWNTASQVDRSQGLTDRQLETAIIIIVKHQRQILNKTGRNIDYVQESKPLRLLLRRVDRRASLTKNTEKKHYELRFPYNRKMIDEINILKSEFGIPEFFWDKKNRRWLLDATEPNLGCLNKFLSSRTYFDIDTEAQQDLDLYQQYSENSTQWVPTVDLVGTNTVVLNSNSHIDQELEKDQYNKLSPVDAAFRAHLYGLSIGSNLQQYIETNHSDIAKSVISNPAEIQNQRRVYTDTITEAGLECLAENIATGGIVFVSTLETNESFNNKHQNFNKKYPGKFHLLYVGAGKVASEAFNLLPADPVIVMDINEIQHYSLRRRIHFIDSVSDYIDNQALKVLYIKTEEMEDLFL